MTRVFLTVILLQVLDVDRVEANQVLSVVDVLAKRWKAIGFIYRASMMSGVDDLSSITKTAATMITAS